VAKYKGYGKKTLQFYEFGYVEIMIIYVY